MESGHLWVLVEVKVVQGEGGEFLNWSAILGPLLCARPWKRMLCPSKENQIASSGLDCCWIVQVHLAERCSVRTSRALRVAPPLPTWQFFIINNDVDFEIFIIINYQLRVAHWHRGHPRLDRIIDKKKASPPRQGLPPPGPQQKNQTAINIAMLVSGNNVCGT